MPHTPQSRVLNLSALALALKQQANVRIGICIFMGAYFSPTEFLFHPLYLSFIAYSVFIFGLTRKGHSPCIGTRFIFFTLSFDVIFSIISLHLVGSYGYFLFLILIQICFGYGVRFGTPFLWASTLITCFGILTLFLISDYWRIRPFEVISFLAGVPFLSIYIHYLNSELKAAKTRSDIQASTYSKLLQFVSHDIRTQLQVLWGASEEILKDNPNSGIVQHIIKIREIIDSLARLATNFVDGFPGKLDYSDRIDAHSTDEAAELGEWIGRICLRFSPQIRANQTRLTVGFSEDIPIFLQLDFSSLERILINSLSNAVRYSKYGAIEIEITLEPQSSYRNLIVIQIKNTCPGGFEKASSSSDTSTLSQRLFFGSGLGHAINNAIALEAGGSFSAKVDGPEIFKCEIQLPCTFYAGPARKPMEYPIVYFSKSLENYQRVKALLLSTCSLYRSSCVFYPARRKHLSAEDIAVFLYDVAVNDAPSKWKFGDEYLKAEEIRCDVHLGDSLKEAYLGNFSICAALATRSRYSLNNAIAFAAAYNQKNAKFEIDHPYVRGADLKLSGIYIEDSNFSSKSVLAAAHREGWRLDCANLASQALQMLQHNEYDFILMDWELEHGTALDILDAYRQHPCQRDCIRIIILSGHERVRISELLGIHKVDLVLEKPISTDALMKRIADCFRSDRDKLNTNREELVQAPLELFDSGSYENHSDGSMRSNSAICLLDAFVIEIETALEELSRLQDSTGLEIGRIAHRLIGVAEAGGAILLANRARNLIAELDQSNDRFKLYLNQLNAIWTVTVRHVRTFRETLSHELP